MKRGFTMVEVLVTVVLVSVALVGVFGGLRSLQAADARAQTADLLQRLASEKVADLKLLSDPATGATSGATSGAEANALADSVRKFCVVMPRLVGVPVQGILKRKAVPFAMGVAAGASE